MSFLLILLAFASDAAQIAPAPKLVSLEMGSIVFYRGASVMGFAIACPVRYKGIKLVELGRGKFARWTVPAGRYILNNKTSSIEVAVGAGEKRYVRCTLKHGMLTSQADLQLVDAESFESHRADFEEKQLETPR